MSDTDIDGYEVLSHNEQALYDRYGEAAERLLSLGRLFNEAVSLLAVIDQTRDNREELSGGSTQALRETEDATAELVARLEADAERILEEEGFES